MMNNNYVPNDTVPQQHASVCTPSSPMTTPTQMAPSFMFASLENKIGAKRQLRDTTTATSTTSTSTSTIHKDSFLMDFQSQQQNHSFGTYGNNSSIHDNNTIIDSDGIIMRSNKRWKPSSPSPLPSTSLSLWKTPPRSPGVVSVNMGSDSIPSLTTVTKNDNSIMASSTHKEKSNQQQPEPKRQPQVWWKQTLKFSAAEKHNYHLPHNELHSDSYNPKNINNHVQNSHAQSPPCCFICQRSGGMVQHTLPTAHVQQQPQPPKNSLLTYFSSSSSRETTGITKTSPVQQYHPQQLTTTGPRTSMPLSTTSNSTAIASTITTCTFCERQVCKASCTKQCEQCCMEFCTLCSTVDYSDSRIERTFCLDCHQQQRYHHGGSSGDDGDHSNSMDTS